MQPFNSISTLQTRLKTVFLVSGLGVEDQQTNLREKQTQVMNWSNKLEINLLLFLSDLLRNCVRYVSSRFQKCVLILGSVS